MTLQDSRNARCEESVSIATPSPFREDIAQYDSLIFGLQFALLLAAAGERRAADDGDVAGDVVGRCAEPGRPIALVDGDNDDGGRTDRRRYDPGGWRRRARLLRERQADDDGPGHGANGVQLPVRQRGEAGAGRLSEASAHRDLLLLLPHADAVDHRPGALSQHRHGRLRVLLAIGKSGSCGKCRWDSRSSVVGSAVRKDRPEQNSV